MTKADKMLLVGIILVSILSGAIYQYIGHGLAARSTVRVAVVKVNGIIVLTQELKKEDPPESFIIAGALSAVTIETVGGMARVAKADCPDQLCLKQGWIDSPGASVICVPNKLAIQIEGKSEVDAVTR